MPNWYADPHWALAIVFVIGGFAVLLKGADWLVEGAVALASRLHLAPAVIGATVVAFGTSLPELIVSVGSSTKAIMSGSTQPGGPADIAIANIVGSNVFNIGAILGFTALLGPMAVSKSTIKNDYPLMMVVFALFILFSMPWSDDVAVINRYEGAILTVGLIIFTVMCIKFGKVDTDDIPQTEGLGTGAIIGSLALGIILLPLGGELALTGGIKLAEEIGMSNRVIGLTVMAMGTSLPELVTSIQAARQGHSELAVGNVVGSNLFNVLCIIGISSMIFPLPVAPKVLSYDFIWMMGFAVVLLPMLLSKGGIKRIHGIILSVGLVVFVALALIPDGSPAANNPPADQPIEATEPAGDQAPPTAD